MTWQCAAWPHRVMECGHVSSRSTNRTSFCFDEFMIFQWRMVGWLLASLPFHHQSNTPPFCQVLLPGSIPTIIYSHPPHNPPTSLFNRCKCYHSTKVVWCAHVWWDCGCLVPLFVSFLFIRKRIYMNENHQSQWVCIKWAMRRVGCLYIIEFTPCRASLKLSVKHGWLGWCQLQQAMQSPVGYRIDFFLLCRVKLVLILLKNFNGW